MKDFLGIASPPINFFGFKIDYIKKLSIGSMLIFQNMVMFTSSYIQCIIYVCLNSWMLQSVTTNILYLFFSIHVSPSFVSDSSLKTINNTSFVNNYSFFIVFDFTTFFSLETWRLKLSINYSIKSLIAFKCAHSNILLILSPLSLACLFSSLV